MPNRYYTASATRDEGRERYSATYRHPARLDPSTGKPGRRVRRGLGTSDAAEAERLIGQLNELLSHEEYWSVSARTTASERFDPRVVAAFFDGMEPQQGSSREVRDRLIPLPPSEDGYRRVHFLGTTGAGKTTVVRQILGTDPATDRFPSTSTAKTTIADTEVIIADPPYRAVITFSSRDEVIDHLTDCASKASFLALGGASQDEIRNALLDHENQRYRFSYILGRRREARGGKDGTPRSADLDDFADEEDADPSTPVGFAAEPQALSGIDLDATASVIDNSVATLQSLVQEHESEARLALGVDGGDERVFQEILEEELDRILRGDERFHHVVDSLLEEIDKRFDALSTGTITRDQQSWPESWYLESSERNEFLRAVNRFSSNYAPLFGHLLSPLVDGIRVSGPFSPVWAEGALPKLVLMDGEGLGHTPKSSASLPTAIARTLETVDAIVLVDSAASPMQAAPASAIRSILTSGNADKLIYCFTHFDEVKGDNLHTPADRVRHVRSSVDNLLSSIREEFGPRSERMLRRRLDTHGFYLADIQEVLDSAQVSGRRTISQLKKMLAAIETISDRPDTGPSRPVYDKANLVLAIQLAIRAFHRRWRSVLGLPDGDGADKEHWTRIKALNRRFAEGTADQYDTLRPAADLREALKDEIYRSLESPLRWQGTAPESVEVIDAAVNEFSNAVTRRLFDPIRETLSVRPQRTWQDAFSLSGKGSTFVRARRISDDVFARNVPEPGVTPSPDQNSFLHAVLKAVDEAAIDVGAVLV